MATAAEYPDLKDGGAVTNATGRDLHDPGPLTPEDWDAILLAAQTKRGIGWNHLLGLLAAIGDLIDTNERLREELPERIAGEPRG